MSFTEFYLVFFGNRNRGRVDQLGPVVVPLLGRGRRDLDRADLRNGARHRPAGRLRPRGTEFTEFTEFSFNFIIGIVLWLRHVFLLPSARCVAVDQVSLNWIEFHRVLSEVTGFRIYFHTGFTEFLFDVTGLYLVFNRLLALFLYFTGFYRVFHE